MAITRMNRTVIRVSRANTAATKILINVIQYELLTIKDQVENLVTSQIRTNRSLHPITAENVSVTSSFNQVNIS
jgi:hypothetical protein